MKNRAYLSLGSNLDKETSLPRAVSLLGRAGRLAAVSCAYETAPVGRAAQPSFLNAAVLLVTAMSPEEVKGEVIAGIERSLGRVRDSRDRNAPRTIDVDISLWNDEIRLILGKPVPDPDILVQAHVAVPLAAIAPDLVHPESGETLAAIAERLGGEGGRIRRRPDIVLQAGG